MINIEAIAEVFCILKKTSDNVSKAIDELDGIYENLPKYLRTEILHPKKKPRGSIRRERKSK